MAKKVIIFDLDQTIIDSSIAEKYRDSRDWKSAISLVPKMIVYEGIMDVLLELKKNDQVYSVITSSPSHYSSAILNYFGITPEYLIAYHDTKYHKPHPEPFHFLLSKYDSLECKDVVSIGDNAKDIIASKAAGISTIGVLWGNTDNEELIKSNPEILVSSPIEILKYIL